MGDPSFESGSSVSAVGRPASADVCSPGPTDETASRSGGPGKRLAPSGPVRAFRPGHLVGRRYRVLGMLGRGGMGEVYEVEDLELTQRVALKVLRSELADQPGAVERLKREISLARQVAHSNVCRTFDVGFHVRDDGLRVAFLTMELVHGETLAARLRRDGPIEPIAAWRWALQIAEGLAAAHRAGVVHRDLKCGNILLDESSGQRAVITDFGLARGAQEAPSASGSSAPVGTWGYMAPEQLVRSDVDAAADVYAAGVVLREMITGTRAGHPAAAGAAAPPGWDSLLARCLSPRPADRFADGAALLSALRRLPDDKPRARRPRRRSAWLVAGTAAALLVGTVAWRLAGGEVGTLDARALPSDPEAALAYREALHRMASSDALAARDLLQLALARAPDDPLLRSALGEVLRQLGDERSAADMARLAFARRHALPVRERVLIEARYREANLEWEKAGALYRQLAIAAPAEVEFGLGLARVLQRIGSPDEVFATLAALRQLPPPAGADPRIDETESAMAALVHDWPRAVRAAARAAHAAERQHAWFRAGENRFAEAWAVGAMGGPHDVAVQRTEEALRHYERGGDEASQGRAMLVRGNLEWDRGDLQAAQRAYRESARLSHRAGALREEGLARFVLSRLLGRLGDLSAALAEAERVVAIGGEIGHRGLRFSGLVLLGHWRAAQGSYAAAGAEIHRALPIGHELGRDVRTATALDELGRVRLHQGEFATARRNLEDAVAIAGRSGGAAVSIAGEVGLVAVELADGHVEGARERLAGILDRASGPSLAEALLLRAHIALARGDTADARAAMRIARERRDDVADMELRLRLEVAEGRLLAANDGATGRRAARQLLASTIARARDKGWFVPQVEARLALAEIHMRRRARAAARAELEIAGEMIRARGALRWSRIHRDLSAAADPAITGR